MNKKELTNLIATKVGTTKEAKEIITSVFNLIKHSLRYGDKVVISGFGTFYMKKYKPKVGRNPKTGEVCQIPEKEIFVNPDIQLME